MSTYGQNADVRGTLLKPYEGWFWYAGGSSNVTFQYECVVPASVWTNIAGQSSTTPVSASAVLQSNGSIKFPVNGVYTINFNVPIGNGANQSNWWTVNTIATMGITNNNTLWDKNLGTSVWNSTSSYTGYFSANDSVFPTTYSSNPGTNFGGNNFRFVMSVILIHRCQ